MSRPKNWFLLPSRHAGPPRPSRLASEPVEFDDRVLERFAYRADDSLIWSMARDASAAVAANLAMAYHPGRVPVSEDPAPSLRTLWGEG